MRLEDLKEEYPVMPENIRQMIEREVIMQVNDKGKNVGKQIKTKRSWRKSAAIALVATMAIGTTVFAGTKIFQWHIEKEGDYGLKAGVVADKTSADQAALVIPNEIPALSIKAEYLPDGMVAADDGSTKYYYEKTPYHGGVSINAIVMDEQLSADKLPLSDTYVTASEMLSIAGKEAVYLEKQTDDGGSIGFDKKIYVAYPEYWQILEIFVGEDVSKEEALKIAENLKIETTGEKTLRSESYTWSAMLKEESQDSGAKMTASNTEMGNTHKIGEAFSVSAFASTDSEEWIDTDAIQAKVTDVQIADDYKLLDNEFVDSDLKTALGTEGKLVQNEVTYYKEGNGIDSLDEIVRKENVNQKLVYTTVEYKNTGNQELKNVLFFASFVGIVEDNNGYAFYDRAQCDGNDDTDYVSMSSIGCLGEMDYYDIHGGERNNNYISSIKPGETVTLHVAKVVNKDELDKMYLSFDSSGGAYELSEKSLQTGYVDIRQ